MKISDKQQLFQYCTFQIFNFVKFDYVIVVLLWGNFSAKSGEIFRTVYGSQQMYI